MFGHSGGRWSSILIVTVISAISLIASACSEPGSDIDIPAATAATTTQDSGSEPTDASGSDDADSGGSKTQASSDEVQVELDVFKVDQFGYRPADPKVAVIVDPQVGYNADVDFTPGAQIEIRRWSDGELVFSGPPEAWSDGETHDQSGDKGWWFDFSEISEPGSYYLVDPDTGMGSGRFEIAEDVYQPVLDAALKMFWFNRGNTPHPAEFAGPWSDDAAYVGPDQDTEARSIDDPENAATARDLSGGWFDAGDTNKYVTFAVEPVHELLTAFDRYPDAFSDSIGIPESGNGIPDVLDEIGWEIDWLKRMQLDDGGVLVKVGVTGHPSPGRPSEFGDPRYYEGVCSSSTIAAAGMFAHAAVVFSGVPELAAEVDDLRERAERSWRWFQNSTLADDCDPQIIKAGDADWPIEIQRNAEVVAAIYLAALTDDDAYDEVVSNGVRNTFPFASQGFGDYRPDQADALLHYRTQPSADAAVVAAIDERLAEIVPDSLYFGPAQDVDLYRSFMPDNSYHWGSNSVKASIGSANLAIDGVPGGRERALGHVHYFHGVNPLGAVFLSNAGELGAERSMEILFHYWFGDGTEFDVGSGSEIGVAPGYVVGGPNRAYTGGEQPPAGQPPQKAYADRSSKGAGPDWEITEPAIYYQAAYVRLLAAVVHSK